VAFLFSGVTITPQSECRAKISSLLGPLGTSREVRLEVIRVNLAEVGMGSDGIQGNY